jgi:hypothetical protein
LIGLDSIASPQHRGEDHRVRIFRVQLRAEGEDADAVVQQRATGMAMARVTELGVGHRDVRASAQNMADVWA